MKKVAYSSPPASECVAAICGMATRTTPANPEDYICFDNGRTESVAIKSGELGGMPSGHGC
jgi:hypothetical protein